jgi:hypothetical protein
LVSEITTKILENNMYALTFQPWVGKSYHNGGIFGNENLFEYYCQNSKKVAKIATKMKQNPPHKNNI